MLGIEYPIVAFSHCRDVVAAVSRAGGFGVLGAAAFSPEELDRELSWLDQHSGGRPYGVDLVFPVNYLGDEPADLTPQIPTHYRQFVDDLMQRFGIPARTSAEDDPSVRGHVRAREQWDVCRTHPIRLVASALGPAPPDIRDEAHDRGIYTAGLVGTPKHATRHQELGTDIIIAQGTEAGGHTGDVTTMVLVPQVVDAVHPAPVLAAGGIGDGRQVAASLALGAVGVWTGSIWLTTAESDLHPAVKKKLLAASSRDTVRSKCRTGKPVRQLRTPWVDSWESPEAPKPLPAPLQQMLVREATLSMIEHGIEAPMGTPVGQIVGMVGVERAAAAVLYQLVDDYLTATHRITEAARAAIDGGPTTE